MQGSEQVRDYLDNMVKAEKTPGLQYMAVNQDLDRNSPIQILGF